MVQQSSQYTYQQTFTLTYGNCAENHKSMQIIGNQLKSGLTIQDLQTAKSYFTKLGAQCDIIDLKLLIKDSLSDDEFNNIQDAHLLVVKQGAGYLLKQGFQEAKQESNQGQETINYLNELYEEQQQLDKDKKAFMKGRVVNKKARHNLCFSDFDQIADYQNKKGTVINFNRVKYTNMIRNMIPQVIPIDQVKNLQCEGNYYYDVSQTYIGFHGDSERQIVIAVRLGADFNLYYQWYHKSNTIGQLFEITLSHGDMYFMSDKSVGTDWKQSSKMTLRHAAGNNKKLLGLNE